MLPITLNIYMCVYVPIGDKKLPIKSKINVITSGFIFKSSITSFISFFFFIILFNIASAKNGITNIIVTGHTDAWKFTINTDIKNKYR